MHLKNLKVNDIEFFHFHLIKINNKIIFLHRQFVQKLSLNYLINLHSPIGSRDK